MENRYEICIREDRTRFFMTGYWTGYLRVTILGYGIKGYTCKPHLGYTRNEGSSRMIMSRYAGYHVVTPNTTTTTTTTTISITSSPIDENTTQRNQRRHTNERKQKLERLPKFGEVLSLCSGDRGNSDVRSGPSFARRVPGPSLLLLPSPHLEGVGLGFFFYTNTTYERERERERMSSLVGWPAAGRTGPACVFWRKSTRLHGLRTQGSMGGRERALGELPANLVPSLWWPILHMGENPQLMMMMMLLPWTRSARSTYAAVLAHHDDPPRD
ncbi:hypothetical protein F5X96DRAFT_399748 [Biscogniauxia mediterranea]|nr:hypothetical protein F5X96DRAFT_399748 [Biscogniauxia mediterranea]